MYSLQHGWECQICSKKLNNMSTNSMKYFSTLENINNQSCNLVPHDVQCNTVNVELCEDDQLYQPLTSDLYSIPEHFVPVFNTCIEPSPAPCHFVESEKTVKNKFVDFYLSEFVIFYILEKKFKEFFDNF